jgi:hypothetical protein
MGAQPDQHRDFRLDRAELALDVRRLLVEVLGFGIAQVAVQLGQFFEDRFRALDDPDRLAAPLEHQALAFDQAGDVGGDRRASQFGAGAGHPGLDERDRCTSNADGTHHGGGHGQEAATTRVNRLRAVTLGVIRPAFDFCCHPALRKT